MLSRVVRWLFGRHEPSRMDAQPEIDTLGLRVVREQRRLAKRLSKLPGVSQTPEQLLDYRRADAAWSRKR